MYEGNCWFEKRFKGESRECRAPETRQILRLVFLKKPDAKLEEGLRVFRAIALLSALQVVDDGPGGPAARRKGAD